MYFCFSLAACASNGFLSEAVALAHISQDKEHETQFITQKCATTKKQNDTQQFCFQTKQQLDAIAKLMPQT
jgi:hypothetical protein